jgi:hypothetical protein
MALFNYIKDGEKFPILAFKGDKGEKGDKGDNGTPVVILTQEEYDSLQTPLANTLYVITED